jgi:hypothetical protein
MKTTTTLFKTLFILLVTHTSFAQYSDASLNGAWKVVADDDAYILFDGAGGITEMGVFDGAPPTNIGTYSVSSSGAITGNLSIFSMDFTGQFSSATAASLVSEMGTFPMDKITSPGLLAETLTGSFVSDGETKNVVLSVDALGEITSATGDLNILYGRIYSLNGAVMGYIQTDDANCWNQFIVNGTYASNTINGTINVDCNTIPEGVATLQRTGQASSAGLTEIAQNHFSFYPSPTSGILTVKNTNTTAMTVTIVDITGKVVKEVSVKGNAQQHADISAFGEGVYFIKTETNEVYRLIKN